MFLFVFVVVAISYLVCAYFCCLYFLFLCDSFSFHVDIQYSHCDRTGSFIVCKVKSNGVKTDAYQQLQTCTCHRLFRGDIRMHSEENMPFWSDFQVSTQIMKCRWDSNGVSDYII